MTRNTSIAYAPAAQPGLEDETFQSELDRAPKAAFIGMVRDLAAKAKKNG